MFNDATEERQGVKLIMKENNPKISCIVPVYNVEKYLERCIDSILTQTFTNFELILVDDGSSDGCPAICEEYAKKDKRVKVIHKENGGLGYARNSGLDIACGEYITFVDSDDYIPNNAMEILMANIGDSDICAGEHISFKCSTPKYKNSIKSEVLYTVDVFRNILNIKLPYNYQFGKLYKKELFETVRYSNLLYEDVEINYRLLSQCKKVTICYSVVYFYNVGNQNSITSCHFTKRHFDQILTAKILSENVERSFPFLKANCRKYFCNTNLVVLKRLIKNKCTKEFPEQYMEIMSCFYKNKKYLFTDLKLSKKIKVLLKIVFFDFYFLFTKSFIGAKKK